MAKEKMMVTCIVYSIYNAFNSPMPHDLMPFTKESSENIMRGREIPFIEEYKQQFLYTV